MKRQERDSLERKKRGSGVEWFVGRGKAGQQV